MGDIITGHIDTPPGTLHTPPEGACCDKHPSDAATFAVQGDTDAGSAVIHYQCEFCHQKYLMQAPEPEGGDCEWCGQYHPALQDYRNLREGLMAPLERVCPPCIHQDQESIIDDVPSEQDGIDVRDADADLNDDDTYFHDEEH